MSHPSPTSSPVRETQIVFKHWARLFPALEGISRSLVNGELSRDSRILVVQVVVRPDRHNVFRDCAISKAQGAAEIVMSTFGVWPVELIQHGPRLWLFRLPDDLALGRFRTDPYNIQDGIGYRICSLPSFTTIYGLIRNVTYAGDVNERFKGLVAAIPGVADVIRIERCEVSVRLLE